MHVYPVIALENKHFETEMMNLRFEHYVKVSKYGPEKTPYLETFHAVEI